MRRLALASFCLVTATATFASARLDTTLPSIARMAWRVLLGPAFEREAEQVEAKRRSREQAELADIGGLELWQTVTLDPESLGSMSFGRPNRGMLFNGVQMPPSPLWTVVEEDKAWGTRETIDKLSRAIGAVHEEFSDAHPLHIGHISRRKGGYLRPHRSHQSGRDVDVSYYYTDGPKWYVRATEANLDTARTWVFVRAVLDEGVDFVFIDRSIQVLLRRYAEAIGEDAEWLSLMFDGRTKREAIIRHAWGHTTHLHVRFTNPDAERMAQRARKHLIKARLIPAVRWY